MIYLQQTAGVDVKTMAADAAMAVHLAMAMVLAGIAAGLLFCFCYSAAVMAVGMAAATVLAAATAAGLSSCFCCSAAAMAVATASDSQTTLAADADAITTAAANELL